MRIQFKSFGRWVILQTKSRIVRKKVTRLQISASCLALNLSFLNVQKLKLQLHTFIATWRLLWRNLKIKYKNNLNESTKPLDSLSPTWSDLWLFLNSFSLSGTSKAYRVREKDGCRVIKRERGGERERDRLSKAFFNCHCLKSIIFDWRF